MIRAGALAIVPFAVVACAAPASGPASSTAASPPASGAAPAAPQPLANTRWVGMLPAGADARHAPRIEFSTAGRLNGFTGCNMMSGSYSVEGDTVRLGPIAATKRFCVGPEMEYEKQVLAAMGPEARVTRSGDKLVFEAAGGRYEFAMAKE